MHYKWPENLEIPGVLRGCVPRTNYTFPGRDSSLWDCEWESIGFKLRWKWAHFKVSVQRPL